MKKSGGGRVLVPGIFDFFHTGHQTLLKNIIEKGTGIIIGIFTDSWILRKTRKYARYQEQERYEKVSKWIGGRYSPCSFDIQIHFLNDNEFFLIKQNELQNVVCGMKYHLTKFLPDNMKIVEVKKVRGISSRQIEKGSHPLCASQEIWICRKKKGNIFPGSGECLLEEVLKEKKIPHKIISDLSYFGKGFMVDKITTIIFLSFSTTEINSLKKARLSKKYFENEKITILTQGKDFENAEVLINILQEHSVNRIAPAVLHDDKIEYFQNFRILLHKKRIEEGGYGSVYPALHTIHTEKKYVAKVIKISNQQDFLLECSLSVRAGKMGYGPKVFAYYYTPVEETGIIIMERWDGDMDKKFLSAEELGGLLNVVHKMHDDGVFHHDLYMRNILHRTNPHNSTREFCVTDYGLAYPLETPMSKDLQAADLASLVYGLYDIERVSIMDGIHPKERQKEAWENLLSSKRLSLRHWITGIRWHVINTIGEDGIAYIPTKIVDFVDGIEMYECLFQSLNKQLLHGMPISVLLDRLAYTEWMSSSKTYLLDKKLIHWYFTLPI